MLLLPLALLLLPLCALSGSPVVPTPRSDLTASSPPSSSRRSSSVETSAVSSQETASYGPADSFSTSQGSSVLSADAQTLGVPVAQEPRTRASSFSLGINSPFRQS